MSNICTCEYCGKVREYEFSSRIKPRFCSGECAILASGDIKLARSRAARHLKDFFKLRSVIRKLEG